MIFLALAILCSTAIVVVFKLAGPRTDPLSLVTVNYGAAVLAGLALLPLDPPDGGLTPSPALLALGAGVGLLFVAGFVLLGRAIREAGLSLATATMRLSVAIPFLASWLIWGEVPTPGQGAGLVLAGLAFLLISSPPPAESPSPPPESPTRPLLASILLGLLFVVGGVVDTSFKLFEEGFAEENSRALFLLMVFAFAFVAGGTLLLRDIRRGRPGPGGRDVGWGVVLGLVNYGSAAFMLAALREVPGTVAFPVNNVAVVLLALLLGMGFWREPTSRLQRGGLALAVVALLLFGV
ncbi:MAG: hypothetical protein EA422_09055 [Gemmatimonadales bacterium]|nr:MAG: hypothetical protein EA422_09055 [Gemmatimonadales bacterium]